jgi:K+/H+ antiporter YhaU regulatory subunit KhtT
MKTNVVFNLLKPNQELMLEEWLNVFRVPVNRSLIGRSLHENRIREQTGCSVIAVQTRDRLILNPDPATRLGPDDELILIGAPEAEERYIARYAED